jgi:DNA-binding PadR family transcriptional regulator
MTVDPGIWEIAVLTMLREAPMHPYQMQRLLKERHKDEVLALKRGSLYHAIARLERAALIEVETTGRDGRRPERTTYRITPAGIEAVLGKLRQIIATPRQEPSEFMAAMSFLVHLSPEEALECLPERERQLQAAIDARTAGMEAASAVVDRINLVESEYLLVMQKAELGWVRALEEDLRSGKLTWNTETIIRGADASRRAAARGKEKS